jgi:hypothetical protein
VSEEIVPGLGLEADGSGIAVVTEDQRGRHARAVMLDDSPSV